MKFRIGIIAVIVVAASALPVLAQDEWSFSLTPGVWLAGLEGDVQLGASPDEIRVTYSEGLVGSELGGGLALEGSNGRFGFFAEGIVLDVSDGAEAPSILLQTVDATLEHQIWSIGATYRLRKSSPQVDAVAGFRFFDVDADIAIIEGDAVLEQGTASENWLDFTFGARVRQEFGTKWTATALLDFGAGDSELSYQLLLGLGYRVSPAVTANFGYRLIGSDFQILTKTDTEPPKEVNEYHYSSMKIGGLFANIQFNW